MNLYDLHTKPESLYGYEKADKEVAVVIWEKYKDQPKELKKREAAIATDPRLALLYAEKIIKGRFPKGEAAIAKSADDAYLHARDVIKGRWLKAETVIARHPGYAHDYAEAFNLHFDPETKTFSEKKRK